MYDIFDEEYIRRVQEKEIRKESREEGIDTVLANMRKAGISEDMIQNIAKMSRA